MYTSVKTLLASIVDYAGLFPPAKLGIEAAIVNYAKYQSTPYSWMLNNFVLPVSRLHEFTTIVPTLDLKQRSLSLIISNNWKSELEIVHSLQLRHSKNHIAVTSLEFPILSPIEIEKVIPHLTENLEVFFEIPLKEDLKPYLAVLKNTKASAKIRTGGMTVEAFPTVTQLFLGILAFAEAQVPFKATAGLHHPLPGNYCITYEPDSPSTLMHGFLNVAVMAALVYWQKVTPQAALEVLQDASNSFYFTDNAITWGDYQLNIAEIEQARQRFFRSFGSCSFEEPIDNLQELKLL
ncbi:hypothetical protein I8752_35575 [Nostocaceae cyanobacterium CENA369]|uniref:Uncharacterized protein n=1 Tax=Dendronalium phyllosphericum CENA369 TaxID=1725256 RepID=A0A8J7IVU1_9NOST|nr:hypothetical protein [Dendronalium phyllosphericum]MBH8578177.1 hypothetical protein [Dendronalium phyllosphericum CENA369]